MSKIRRPATGDAANISVIPSKGWHCSHFFYRFDRVLLAESSEADLSEGAAEIIAILEPESQNAPQRLQISIVSGHKADFSLMVMDGDPLKVDSVHQSLLASRLGSCLIPTYSYVSMSEISEYVPTLEQYGKRLVAEGEEEGSSTYEAKLKAYEQREVHMRKQRLTPDFPEWPATCFYPMNKSRRPGANWFMLPSSERHDLMTEHGRTGMQFAGRVTQLITVSVGLDDWEWGVTLWATNPEYLKEIVYRMRFDEASAKYAEFGPFYTSYISSAKEMLAHCRVAS